MEHNTIFFKTEEKPDSSFCWWHICELYVLFVHPWTSHGACEYRLCSQLYISPPQLCHTIDSTIGMLSSVGVSCRAALGSINFIAYFFFFLQPVSLYASWRICFNCSHSCEILCIPRFYGCLLLQILLISLFASWCPSQHLCIFIFFDLMLMISATFMFMENAINGWWHNVFLLCNLARISSLVHFQFLDSEFRQYFFSTTDTIQEHFRTRTTNADLDRYMQLTRAETKVVVAAEFGGSRIDGLLIIPLLLQ